MVACGSMAEHDALSRADVRTPVLKGADPIGTVVSAVMAIAGALSIGERFGLTADQVMAVIGALGTIATVVRAYLEARNAQRVVTMAEQREQAAHREGLLKPQPPIVQRMGIAGREGGRLEVAEDERPTMRDKAPTVERRG